MSITRNFTLIKKCAKFSIFKEINLNKVVFNVHILRLNFSRIYLYSTHSYYYINYLTITIMIHDESIKMNHIYVSFMRI